MVCVHVCGCMQLYRYIWVCVYLYISIYLFVYIYIYIYIYIYTYVHICTYTYMLTYTYVYQCMYRRGRRRRGGGCCAAGAHRAGVGGPGRAAVRIGPWLRGRGAQLRGVGRLRQRGGDPVLPDRVQAQLGGGLYYRPLLLRGMKAEGSCARQAFTTGLYYSVV